MVGRIYLGMHSLIDIIGGLAMGLLILSFWLTVHEVIDNFIVSGQNGMFYSCYYNSYINQPLGLLEVVFTTLGML